MPIEQVGNYEIEFTGVALELDIGWGAYLAIYAPSTNPMHQTPIFPLQRVALETSFSSEAAAAAEARRIGLAKLQERADRSVGKS